VSPKFVVKSCNLHLWTLNLRANELALSTICSTCDMMGLDDTFMIAAARLSATVTRWVSWLSLTSFSELGFVKALCKASQVVYRQFSEYSVAVGQRNLVSLCLKSVRYFRISLGLSLSWRDIQLKTHLSQKAVSTLLKVNLRDLQKR
jgi:hypothetical protein